MSRTFLTRHGDYFKRPEQISERGQAQAEQAAQTLADQGVGTKTLIVASDAPRAVQSAIVIQRKLRAEHMFASPVLRAGAELPRGIQSLGDFLQLVIATEGIETSTIDDKGDKTDIFDDLVVVTHMPMIRMITKDSVGHGDVIEYTPGSWPTDEFSELHREKIADAITLARATARQNKPPTLPQ